MAGIVGVQVIAEVKIRTETQRAIRISNRRREVCHRVKGAFSQNPCINLLPDGFALFAVGKVRRHMESLCLP